VLKRPSGREAYPGDVFLFAQPAAGTRGASRGEVWATGSLHCPAPSSRRKPVTSPLTFRPTFIISSRTVQIYLETDLSNIRACGQPFRWGLSVSRGRLCSATQSHEAGRGSTERRSRTVSRGWRRSRNLARELDAKHGRAQIESRPNALWKFSPATPSQAPIGKSRLQVGRDLGGSKTAIAGLMCRSNDRIKEFSDQADRIPEHPKTGVARTRSPGKRRSAPT